MLITYSYRTYPRTQPVWSIGRSERDRLARSRYRRMAAGPVRNISRMQFKNTSDITLQTDTNRHDNGGELHAKLMSSDRAGFETRCLRGQAAAPVGGGRAWPGNTQTASPDRFEAAAWPAGLGRGAGGRWRGQAAAPVGGGRAWPDNESTRRAKLAARTASGRAAAHGCIKQPGPARQPSGARNSSGAATTRSRPAPQGPGGSRIRPLGGSQRLFQRIWVPSEPRRWQASTTRAAMPASADLPHVRGSYCFFTPTSPSILRTPS